MASAILLLILAAGSILGSPGPAPLSLAATGASYGFRRGLPYLAGLVLAIGIGCLAAAAGVGALLSRGGPLVSLLFVFSVGYVLFIAWKIASAPVLEGDDGPDRVPSFTDGLVLNLTNPKAYAAIVAVYAGFALPFTAAWVSVLATGLMTVMVALAVDVLWLWAGSGLTAVFRNPRLARPLRVAFAALMLIAVGVSAAAAFQK